MRHQTPSCKSNHHTTNTHVLYIISFETNETLRHGGSGVIYLLSIFEILHRKSASEGKRACLSVSCVSPQVWVKSLVCFVAISRFSKFYPPRYMRRYCTWWSVFAVCQNPRSSSRHAGRKQTDKIQSPSLHQGSSLRCKVNTWPLRG